MCQDDRAAKHLNWLTCALVAHTRHLHAVPAQQTANIDGVVSATDPASPCVAAKSCQNLDSCYLRGPGASRFGPIKCGWRVLICSR